MTDDSPAAPLSRRPAQAIRGLVRGAVVLFVLSTAALVWTFWHERAQLPSPSANPQTPASRPAPPIPASPPSPSFSLSVAEARMAALEARLAQAERQATNAKEDASRAERLLILISVRRAIDQGLPLGYLESQLQTQFGGAAPRDVAVIIAGARQPVTLARLNQGLANVRPQLVTASTQGQVISALLEDLRNLAVIRRASAPSNAASQKLARAQQAIAQDRVDLAIREVTALPGVTKAQDWVTRAQRYVAIRAALSRLEAATLLSPKPGAAPAG